jgi:fructose-1,6-bisphosphatase/inositol monophosphatase family enzyme
MSEDDKKQYLEFAKKLAYEAGEIMRRYFGKNPDSEMKADDTIVTIADKEINSLVIQRIKENFPGHSVDGEEESFGEKNVNLWACDPIDGTNPFAMTLAVAVFSLAFVYDGAPKVGVVYDPFADRMFWAAEGTGAYLNGEKTYVSKQKLGPGARISYDQWSRADYDVLTPLAKMAQETGAYMLSPGSTTHASALVAQGDFVASVFPGTIGKNVDIAAAKVIVEEAGGRVTDLFGNEQRYDGDIKGAITSNGVVHDELVRLLKDASR